MEHGAFDMAGLAEYLQGMVESGPTRSGHRTPTVIVEAPVNGTDAANVRFNAWQFRQILWSRGARRPAVPGRVGRRRPRLCRILPLSAPVDRDRSDPPFCGRADAWREAG